MVWISLLLASQQDSLSEEDFTHPQVVALVASLLQIRTIYKASTAGCDEIESTISRIVKQNIDSKVQPVSSLTWASILTTLGDGISLDQALARYNDHPEVQSFEGEGTGSITLDGRKRQARGFTAVFDLFGWCVFLGGKLRFFNCERREKHVEHNQYLSGSPEPFQQDSCQRIQRVANEHT